MPLTGFGLIQMAAFQNRLDGTVPVMPSPSREVKRAVEERAKREERAEHYARFAGPFKSTGEFLQALAHRAMHPAAPAPRLDLLRAPTGAGEVDPSGGGFLVPPQFLYDDFVAPLYENSVIAQFTDRRKTATPLADVRIPAIDQSSRVDGQRWGNVASAWASEADTYTGVAFGWAKTRLLAFNAKKLHLAIVVSSELAQDAPLLQSVVTRAFASEMSFRLDVSILKGSGAGQPQGVLNSGALITIAKEPQASATVVPENINKMWARLPAESRRNAFWIVSEDVEPQLAAMSQLVGRRRRRTRKRLLVSSLGRRADDQGQAGACVRGLTPTLT